MKDIIERAWSDNSFRLQGHVKEAVWAVIEGLDQGTIRVCEKKNGQWHTHAWVKQAILLSFQLTSAEVMEPFFAFDKISLKTKGWTKEMYEKAGFRCVPGSVIRKGAYIAPGAVVMPSFINIGAFVGAGTMIDGGVRVGSCAQVGQNCHIGGGVGLGGVLEPVNDSPVIIEDDCFIGAMSHVSEGVVIEHGSILGAGVHISASTKIVHRETGDLLVGRVPPFSVVVPGSLKTESCVSGLHLDCAVIVKTVDAQTRSKTSLNDLLRR